jgi:hypothetical protein
MNHRQLVQILLTFVVVFAVAFTITSCKKDDNPASPTNGNGNGLSIGTLGSLYLPNIANVGGILGALDVVTSYGGYVVEVKIALAGFYAAAAHTTVYAGAVTANSTALDTAMSSGNVYYMAPSEAHPLNQPVIHFADTAVVNFVVAGSGSITGFSASMNTIAPAAITSPGLLDSASKSANLTVTWTGASAADSVMLFVIDASSHAITKMGLPNTGTYTIQASEMAGFVAGSGEVILVKYHYTVVTKNAVNYALVAETMSTAVVKFY